MQCCCYGLLPIYQNILVWSSYTCTLFTRPLNANVLICCIYKVFDLSDRPRSINCGDIRVTAINSTKPHCHITNFLSAHKKANSPKTAILAIVNVMAYVIFFFLLFTLVVLLFFIYCCCVTCVSSSILHSGFLSQSLSFLLPMNRTIYLFVHAKL